MPNIPLEATPVQAGNMLDELNKLRNQINALAAQIGGGGTGGITGTLTSGLIPVASGATSVVDGSLSDDGANTIGGQNGVDLTIGAGTITTVGTVGYSYGPNLNLNGGNNVGGGYGYGGDVRVNGGVSSGALYDNLGSVQLYGNLVRLSDDGGAELDLNSSASLSGSAVTINGTTGIFLTGDVQAGNANLTGTVALSGVIVTAANLPGTAGASGSLYVDSGAGNVVKRVP